MLASVKRALRYFSTHCWQKKQAASGTICFRRRRICEATVKSFSAFLTHSRVSGFIHDFPPLHDLAKKAVAPAETLLHVGGGSHEQVERQGPGHGLPNPHRHPLATIT